MKMKKYLYFLIFIFVLTSLSVFFYKNLVLRKEINSLVTTNNDLKNLIEENNNLLISEVEKYYSINYVKDYLKIELFDEKMQSFNLENIVKDKKILVYRISENVCNICYDTVILELKDLSSKIGSENILILAPLKRIRELKSYLNELDLKLPFYGVKNFTFEAKVDQYTPYFFFLENSPKPKHIFVPLKNTNLTTRAYLNTIEERYYNQYKI